MLNLPCDDAGCEAEAGLLETAGMLMGGTGFLVCLPATDAVTDGITALGWLACLSPAAFMPFSSIPVKYFACKAIIDGDNSNPSGDNDRSLSGEKEGILFPGFLAVLMPWLAKVLTVRLALVL